MRGTLRLSLGAEPLDLGLMEEDLQSGLSECGKSTAGRFFEQRGFARLKIGHFYREKYESGDREIDFHSWSQWMDRHKQEEIGTYLLERVHQEVIAAGREGATIESLHGDSLGVLLV